MASRQSDASVAAFAQRLRTLAEITPPTRSGFTLGKAIKEELATVLEEAIRATNHGDKIARQRGDYVDATLRVLLEAGEAIHPDLKDTLTILAVGGYGRRFLAPASDIDLLFLHKPNAGDAIKPLLNFILYALFDSGLSIAQAVHTPASAVDFCKTDLNGQTSYLDARYLAGPEKLLQDFEARFEKMRAKSIPAFVQAKLEERDNRHTEAAMSRYAVEPDVKEGKGGLRDLETLHWLYRYAYGRQATATPVAENSFWYTEIDSYTKASHFLWSLRVQIHHIRGRGDDRLTFDLQPEIAQRLGYKDRANATAAERLMKHYFLNAKEVGRLTAVISTVLEEAALKKTTSFGERLAQITGRGKAKPDPAVLADEVGTTPDLVYRGGRLDFARQSKSDETYLNFFRLFRAIGRSAGRDIHPDALKTITSSVKKSSQADRRDPVIASLFRAIILESHDPEYILRQMSEANLLGNYIRPFGDIIGKVEYGLFRRYTVDEHVLRSIGILQKIAAGAALQDHPLSVEILEKTDDPFAFYLTVLMHETAAGIVDPAPEKLRRRVRTSVSRFYKDKQTPDMIAWAVAYREMFVKTAARRNVSDPVVVQRFVREIEKIEHLKLLLVMTVCHLRVAGINSWDNWIRRDIATLYMAAYAWFEGGDTALEKVLQDSIRDRKKRTAQRLNTFEKSVFDQTANRFEDIFWANTGSATAANLIDLVQTIDTGARNAGARARLLKDGLIEVVTYGRDRPGLFADIAATVFSADSSVRAAAAFPVAGYAGGPVMAANIFVMQRLDTQNENASASMDLKDMDLKAIEQKFEAAVQSAERQKPTLTTRLWDRRTSFDVDSAVRFDLESSAECTIVEAEGRDRPGLLYQLSDALSEIGVSIQTAYVATHGEQAVDSFYIQDMPGYKITNKRRLESIRRKLLSVLEM